MSDTVEHPYARFLHRVQKPSRYVGGEHGQVLKEWTQTPAKVCLAFPDVYDIGMSHLGFKILYGILNEHPQLLAERCYAPWRDMEAELRAHAEPLRSLESARPLCDFDVVGFSLQFELTFTNILAMLELGGIPLRSNERGEEAPLVIAGGPVATHCEPLAPFLDAVVIGDGEEKTPEIALAWTSMKEAGVPRTARLRALAQLGGIYVPSLYSTELEPSTGMGVVSRPTDPNLPFPVRRAFIEQLDRYPFPSGGPVSATESVFDRVSVEIARGCTEGCRFCQAGMIYRPVRERDPQSILETITRAVSEGGYDEASLTSLSTADYSAIHPLVKEVMKRFEGDPVALSVSSLRAYGLDEDLLDEIKKVRATGLTFAPEAGSQRMRDVVNKNITEEQLMTTAERVFSRGWSKMKLYFMIGLPTEEEDDVREIVRTGRKAREVGRKVQKGRGPDVTVSVSIHVPKPHTPFQWCAMDPRELVRTKQEWLREEVAHCPGVKLRLHDSDGSWLEGVIARGDRRIAEVIERAYREGARFDSWEECFDGEAWNRAFEACGVDPSPFLATLPTSARLPWDHLDVGLEDGFLLREYRKALSNRLSPPCGKVAGMFVHHTNLSDAERDRRKLVCYDCGVACDMDSMREERLVYLRKLGAQERPAERIPRETSVKVEPKHMRPPPKREQGKPVRIRLAFRKVGNAAYRGHLDLVRVLPRIFRRADMPLFYTEGFHARPDMVFGPALSLGIASLGEYIDVKLDGAVPYAIDGLLETLRRVTEPGIEWLDCRVLGPEDAGLNKVLDEAEYVVAIPASCLRELALDDDESLERMIEEKRSAGGLVVRREIEGIGKNVDVAQFLLRIEVGKGREIADQAGLRGELRLLRFSVRAGGQGSVKASEVVEAFLGKDVPHRAVRVGLFGSKNGLRGTPLELEKFRRVHAPVVEAQIV